MANAGHLHGYPYSQDVITRLHGRAEAIRIGSANKEPTADLLDEAAGCIAWLLLDLTGDQLIVKRIAEANRPDADTSEASQVPRTTSDSAPDQPTPKEPDHG